MTIAISSCRTLPSASAPASASGYHQRMARSIHGTPAGLAPALVALIALAALAGGCAASGVLAACGGTTAGGTTSGAGPAASAAAGPTSEQAQRAGADARSVLTDLAYAGASPSQKLDLYLPAAGTSPYPVILYIHGGGFSGGDKAGGHLAPVLAALSRGYAVASINYRLSGEATFPAQINDVKAAIRWLRAGAARHELDPARIAAWGGSAGGNLAALTGTSGGVAALSDPGQGNAGRSERVQAVVDWYGPISFLRTDADVRTAGFGRTGNNGPESFLSQYLGAALPTVPGKVRAADPTTYISADDPPFFIEHGTADGTVPVQQSTRFAAALETTLGPAKVTLELLPGAGHVDAAFFTPENVDLILDWLDEQLK